MVANICGSVYYVLMVIIFAILGLAFGSVDHPTFEAVGWVLIVAAICMVPVVILFISQIIAGCKAFSQAEELPGGPKHAQTGNNAI